MALSARLELKQSQSLVMTPQLMQAIKLLQLSNLDLVAYVDAELERNPLLEREAGDDAPEPEARASDGADGERADWFEDDGAPSPERVAGVLDTDLGNVYPDDAPAPAAEQRGLDAGALVGSEWAGVGSGGGGGEDFDFENVLTGEIGLHDHLAEQIALAIADPALRLVARDLVDQVDEAGYLRADLDAVAERLGIARATVDEVVAVLQTFEPTGVCARDLSECLALQLAERDRLDPAMRALIDNLDLLARRDLAQLRRLCGVDDEDLADMIREVVALDPKPGASFGSTVVQPVVPDVVVRPGPDGGWLVELNAETLPRVLVNQAYYTEVSRTARGDADKAYLGDCLQTANWLVKSLDQRAKTILKVSSEIVRQQDAFLARGVAHLRPLNLRMIADVIGMHESTVSRVTSNKYMATPRGIFELKYFFTSSIASAEGGDAHSAEAVRHRIRQLVDAEDPADVLSDDTLVKLLRDAGIDIARRTVAKYREAMRIPSSVQRRRLKQSLTA
ncbi:RNA polymerase factor sigma-54 [Oharaeibacter diazotrophicus]|uniref:RNA polymerase sigma-54 factor n=1 Tax=Oharaeibacter diazotrophicus TaxID=1920512 RepID=A0A4R6R6X7_9HYPH|nr:RNA polymerase factor sigma-54 [Oharaeibacter diazotrophicus]TDP81455.1 RNA polymerase RpoN-/SigL-like sigma 54 subunit [Oharaeibacter diazotrophicus]BBE73693.1 RNA polymerase sigma-54 factor 2 [Pleomorphomonas sp. SM30]GLS75482.1 RNA polymerase sigma-54 factor 2 [Oharaeibacter diazotrophicus]